MVNVLKEACVGSLNQAIVAQHKGAHRIELCRDLEVAGLTPLRSVVLQAIELIHIPIVVLVRCRCGDFVYSELEKQGMLEEVSWLNSVGVFGVAIGGLTTNGDLDLAFMNSVCKIKGGLSLTFHMAFDEIKTPLVAIDQLAELGFDRILTRGGAQNAFAGIDNLKKWIDYAKDKVVIMPGGGITSANLKTLVDSIELAEVHGSRIVE